MPQYQFWNITLHGKILLHLGTQESARSNDFPPSVSTNHDHLLLALDELQHDGLIMSEFREAPIGENYFLTPKGKHISNVLRHSVQNVLAKAERSINHLLA